MVDLAAVKQLALGPNGKSLLLSLDELNKTPLLLAISLDNETIVVEILKAYVVQGIDINARDKDGNTCLHHAVQNCTANTIMPLLQLKYLNVGLVNLHKNTALHYFCQKYTSDNAQDILKLLIERGSEVNALNSFGETALHSAILNRSQTAMMIISKIILQSWCDVNTANRNGETALHFAVRRGVEQLVSLLMQYGADPTLQTKSGVSAFMMAGHSPRMIQILEGKLNVPDQFKPVVPPRPSSGSFQSWAKLGPGNYIDGSSRRNIVIIIIRYDH